MASKVLLYYQTLLMTRIPSGHSRRFRRLVHNQPRLSMENMGQFAGYGETGDLTAWSGGAQRKTPR